MMAKKALACPVALIGQTRSLPNIMGGRLGFHAFSEHSFVTGWLLQQVVPRHGVPLASFHGLTGSPERCTALLQAAGFVDMIIYTEDRTGYLSPEEARNQYSRIFNGPYPPNHRLWDPPSDRRDCRSWPRG